jgi:hypothetical protein
VAKGPSGFINFEIVGDQQSVQRMLEHVDSALSVTGLATFMHGYVEPWLVKRAKDRFAGEGDDAVGKWAPLQETTQEFRESAGYGATGPINRRTGELEAYITGNSASVALSPVGATLTFPGIKTTKRSVREKMMTAQKGRGNPSTVPRPVLGLSERDLSHIMVGLALHVRRWQGDRR